MWLLVLPAEAALSGNRRAVGWATGIAAAAAGALALAGAMSMFPQTAAITVSGWAWPLIGALPAVIYCGMLAARTAAVARSLSEEGSAAVARFGAIADHGPDLVVRHRRNGNVTFAAPAARRIFGIDADELCGDGLFRRIHVADRPAYLTALDRAGQGSEGDAEFRLQREASQGPGFIWIGMRCRLLPGSDEIVSILRDVTARKAAEADLGAARDEAERASIAKSRFLARLSHELRTPLNAILGFSEMLTHDLRDRDGLGRQREHAGLIEDGGRHLLDLVNDILDLSRIEAGSFDIVPEPVDLAPMVAEVRGLLEPAAAKAGLTFETDIAFNLPTLHADRRACRRDPHQPDAERREVLARRWTGGGRRLCRARRGVHLRRRRGCRNRPRRPAAPRPAFPQARRRTGLREGRHRPRTSPSSRASPRPMAGEWRYSPSPESAPASRSAFPLLARRRRNCHTSRCD